MPNLFAAAIVITAAISAGVMLYAAKKHRTQRPIYIGVCFLYLYWAAVYFILLTCETPVGFTTTWARPAVIPLLVTPIIFYILIRGTSWTSR